MSLPVQITVGAGGNNPVSGATVWNDPNYAGKTGWLEQTGYGPLKYSDYIVLNTGGVQLLNGRAFGANGETYFFHVVNIGYGVASTNYTNGFNYQPVIAALLGRIGFRQETQTDYAGLVSADNLLSRSGRYYNDFHAVVKAANIKEVQDDVNLSDTDFNTLLQSMQKSAIMRALAAVFSEREFIEQAVTFEKCENSAETLVPNSGFFVGFKIEVAERFDVAVQIDGATLLFDSDINGLPLYLFKDGIKSPVWTGQVNVQAYENTAVVFSDLVLSYINATSKGNVYYFGYFQDDLGNAKAVRHTVEWEDDSKAFCAESMQAKKIDGQINFVRDQISTGYDSYGINLELSSFRDHTQVIVKRANLFDELIGLSMAAMVVEQIIYAMRSNKSERMLRGNLTEASLIQDLNGVAPVSDGPPPIMGLTKRLDREAKRVKDSLFPKPKARTVNIC